MFGGSSGFPFCLDWNLVQCLFTSLWIVLWWWLYVVVFFFVGRAGCDSWGSRLYVCMFYVDSHECVAMSV